MNKIKLEDVAGVIGIGLFILALLFLPLVVGG